MSGCATDISVDEAEYAADRARYRAAAEEARVGLARLGAAEPDEGDDLPALVAALKAAADAWPRASTARRRALLALWELEMTWDGAVLSYALRPDVEALLSAWR